MRMLIALLLALTFPAMALADCPQGNNTPLTADTRAGTDGAVGTNSSYGTHSSYGTDHVPVTAYPH